MPLLTFLGSTSWHERPGGAGGSLSLVPFTPVDMGRAQIWIEEPHVTKWWVTGRGGFPERLERQRSGFVEAMEMAELAPFIIRLNSERIGFLLLRHVNALSGWLSFSAPPETVGIDLFLGNAHQIGKGFGRRTIALGRAAALSDQMVVKLVANPNPKNAAAIGAFVAAGFHVQGSAITPNGASTLLVLDRLKPPQP